MLRQRAETDEVVEVVALDNELAHVDEPVLAADVGDRHVEAAAVGQHRVDEGGDRSNPTILHTSDVNHKLGGLTIRPSVPNGSAVVDS
ncbi:hypothetical protein GCM10009633_25620 [Janibacter melonis]